MIEEFVRSHPRLLSLARSAKWHYRDLTIRHRRVVTYDSAVSMARRWAKQLPNEYDVIIGIPRAGLIPATILAETWGRPLSTPDDFVHDVLWQSERDAVHKVSDVQRVRKVLLVDDTLQRGEAMTEARDMIAWYKPDVEVQMASLFSSAKGSEMGVASFQEKKPSEVLEWNFMSSWCGYRGLPSTDFDGVLCEDYPRAFHGTPETRENVAYLGWLLGAKPYLAFPRFDSVVTSRFERFRPETEEWLEKHRVQCERVVMMPDGMVRTFENVVKFKAAALRAFGSSWYLESSDAIASAVKRLSGIPVLSVREMKLYN